MNSLYPRQKLVQSFYYSVLFASANRIRETSYLSSYIFRLYCKIFTRDCQNSLRKVCAMCHLRKCPTLSCNIRFLDEYDPSVYAQMDNIKKTYFPMEMGKPALVNGTKSCDVCHLQWWIL